MIVPWKKASAFRWSVSERDSIGIWRMSRYLGDNKSPPKGEARGERAALPSFCGCGFVGGGPFAGVESVAGLGGGCGGGAGTGVGAGKTGQGAGLVAS